MSHEVEALDTELEPSLKPKTNLLQVLLPLVGTLAIFAWIFSGIDTGALFFALEGVSVLNVALVVATFCIWMLIADVFSFGAAFKYLIEKKTPWRDLLWLRGGAIFSGVIFPPLAEVIAPYYFYKKWQQSVLKTVGTSFYVVLVDSACGALAVASAFIFFDTSMLSSWWLLLLVGHWALLIALSLLFSRWGMRLQRMPDFIKEKPFFNALRQATVFFTLKIFLVRLSSFIGVGLTLYYLLLAMGIHLEIAQALLFVPLFMFSVFLPISAGGYGGPQGAAMLFLVQLWDLCSPEQALAYSLIWSTLFLIGRAITSGLCVVPLWLVLKKV